MKASYLQRKAWRQIAQGRHDGSLTERTSTPLPKQSRFGFSPTTSDLTTTQVTLRRASQQKTTRKPSMPRMPWEDTDGSA